MGKKFENIKGTYDYLPEKQVLREKIKSTLQNIFIKYGFAPVETPIVCSYDLLASKYSEGADILNEMYKLSDQGKRELGLRYDLTITFAKLISSNPYITMPFKRYEIGKVFRDGPVKMGRNREFTQCDIDMVGVSGLLAEAEYMTMTQEAYEQLGLDVEILFNNRKLLTGIIYGVLGSEIEEYQLRKSIMLIDKFAKLTSEELCKEFEEINIKADKVKELQELLTLSFEELKLKLEQYEPSDWMKQGLAEIEELYGYVQGTKAKNHMVFAPYLARGIDVYTGTVWEVFLKNRIVNGIDFNMSIGGGGRYDKIITMFVEDGKEYPAVGMSFGLDVIFEIMNAQSNKKTESVVELYVIPMGTEREAFALTTALRNAGLKTELEKNRQKVKKSMSYANKQNIPYVTVIGEDEVNRGTIKIKRMEDGQNIECNIHDINEIIQIIHEKS